MQEAKVIAIAIAAAVLQMEETKVVVDAIVAALLVEIAVRVFKWWTGKSS